MIPGNINSLLLAADAAPTGYSISRSLRFNSSDSDLWQNLCNTQEAAK